MRLLANFYAGKSSLTVQYCEGHFVESYYPTIENTFSHPIDYKGQKYATEIIDTAGQVRYSIKVRDCNADSAIGRVQHPQFEALHWHTWLHDRLLGWLKTVL